MTNRKENLFPSFYPFFPNFPSTESLFRPRILWDANLKAEKIFYEHLDGNEKNFLRLAAHPAIDWIVLFRTLRRTSKRLLSGMIWNAGHRYLITSTWFTDRFMNDKIISKDQPAGRFNEIAMKRDKWFYSAHV